MIKTDAKLDKLLVEDKVVVVPGQELASGLGFIPGANTYRAGDVVRAARLGLVNVDGKVVKLVPLSGQYLPRLHDRVIGQVIDVLMTGWRVDFGGPYSAVMSLKDGTESFIPRGADLTQFFALGDFVVAKITNVTSQKLVDVTMKGPGLRKLEGGRIIKVNPQKVPRIVGKDASMVNLLKDSTGCQVVVGQNGLVWIDGPSDAQVVVVDAIRKIESESHLSGLTERVSAFLTSKGVKKLDGKNVNKAVNKTMNKPFDNADVNDTDDDNDKAGSDDDGSV